MKYSLVQQQFKGNPLLDFHGTTQHFYVVDSYSYTNNKKGTYHCISIATMVMQMSHNMCTVYLVKHVIPCTKITQAA